MTSRRDDFFDFGEWTYLNCAYFGPLPRVTAEAVEAALELKRRPFAIHERMVVDVPEAARRAAADFLGAGADEIALATGATHGLNLAAAGLPLGAGDEVLLPPGEFPSNRFPWIYHGQRRGYGVRTFETGGRPLEPEHFERAATPATRAVAVAMVNYSSGYRFDLAGLSALCRRKGWYLVVDGCQGVGNVPCSVADFRPDILATGAYKWLLGPYGAGFTYVRRGLAEELANPVVNWLGIEKADDFSRLAFEELAFAEGARRFDSPEPASFLNVYGMQRSLEYLQQVGMKTVERHHRRLTDHLATGLPGGYRLTSDTRPEHRSGVLCIAGPDETATAAAHRRLLEAKIHLSLREGSIRVSPHLYNDEADIDRLLGHL